jgi:protein-S-isoprenylcysteine O-methyltransferase Ste14
LGAQVPDNPGDNVMEKEIIVVVLFTLFLLAAITPRIVQKLKKVETVGCIGINRQLFFLGKLALFTSFALIPIQLFFVNLSLWAVGDFFFWICMAFAGVGVMLFTLAIVSLGTFSLRVGLAHADTALRTTGVYRFSRNPMVLGLYLIALGSALYVQNPINWLLVIIALAVHHRIILAEERFLLTRFGEQWVSYQAATRRYL